MDFFIKSALYNRSAMIRFARFSLLLALSLAACATPPGPVITWTPSPPDTALPTIAPTITVAQTLAPTSSPISGLLVTPPPAPLATSEPAQSSPPWSYSDLRALAPASSTHPTLDPIALYLRQAGSTLQMRVDTLDDPTHTDFYLALDTQPGGTRSLPLDGQADLDWDILLVLPAQGNAFALLPTGKRLDQLGLMAMRDPFQSMLVASLQASTLPGNAHVFSLEAITAQSGSRQISGRIGPIQSNAPPPGRANLLLAFWEALPGASPAQALRRWDGAHTGPFGQRHGLNELLKAAEQYRMPLTLLDLKTPPSLSALDYLGAAKWVRDLTASGLLLLPDAAWGDPSQTESLDLSLAVASRFGFQASPFLFAASTQPPARYEAAFAWLPGAARVVSRGNLHLVPLPVSFFDFLTGQTPAQEADPQGLALAARQQLLEAALSGDPDRLVVLGGDLPASSWGDSTVAGPAFAYIAGHPWIRPLSGSELLELPACSGSDCLPPGVQPCVDLLCLPEATDAPLNGADGKPLPSRLTATGMRAAVIALLQKAPSGPISVDAWQAYLSLTDPLAPSSLQMLRTGYLSQVSAMLSAAEWAQKSASAQVDCTSTKIPDGQNYCTMQSTNFFGLFDPLGGRLLFAFARMKNGMAEQVVGPTSQLAVGLSDASEWRPDLGPAGDPGVIPGAFATPDDAWMPYQVATTANRIIFTTADGSRQKIYKLIPGGLQIEIHAPGAFQATIPLIFSPEVRFRAGWGNDYHGALNGNSYTLEISGLDGVAVTTNGRLIAEAFSDSRSLLSSGEDPNMGYPPGHYLPMPAILLQAQGQDSLTILLTIH